jgi:hypothetical protein
MECLGGSGAAGLTGSFTDAVFRTALTLPVTPTRFRFRIRNSNALGNSAEGAAIPFNGIAIGPPSLAGLTVWGGVFSSAPTTVVGPFTLDAGATGAETVTPWISNATPYISAYQPFGLSFGFTTAGGSVVNWDYGPGMCWVDSSIVGVAAQFANAATPTLGALDKWQQPLDIRIEYEYAGSNPIGLFLGTSLEVGILTPTQVTYGLCGPDETWPKMAGLRMGHAVTNGAVDGARTTTYDGALSAVAWTRLLDPTYPTLVWPGGCTPDYAVISLGVNDAGSLGLPLATFQANIAAIIANLNALGIYKIIMATPPSLGTGLAYYPTNHGMSGPLGTAIAASGSVASTKVTINNTAPFANIAGSGGGGGYPGPAADWSGLNFYLGMPSTQNLDGPFTCSSAAATAVLLTLTASGTATYAHAVGDAVMGVGEAMRMSYAWWEGQHVLGTLGTFDLAGVVENPVPTVLGPSQVNLKYFGPNNGGPHPQDPGWHEKIAAAFTAAVIGI